MRAVIVLLALVAAPICASVSQNRTGPTRPAPSDRDALRSSNGRNGDWNDRDDGDQDDNDEQCDNRAGRAAQHGSPRSFEVRQDGRHEKRARHRHAGSKHDQDDEDCVGNPPPPPPPTGARSAGQCTMTPTVMASVILLRSGSGLGSSCSPARPFRRFRRTPTGTMPSPVLQPAATRSARSSGISISRPPRWGPHAAPKGGLRWCCPPARSSPARTSGSFSRA